MKVTHISLALDVRHVSGIMPRHLQPGTRVGNDVVNDLIADAENICIIIHDRAGMYVCTHVVHRSLCSVCVDIYEREESTREKMTQKEEMDLVLDVGEKRSVSDEYRPMTWEEAGEPQVKRDLTRRKVMRLGNSEICINIENDVGEMRLEH